MGTWQAKHPELWDAVTEGFGDGWGKKTVDEIFDIQEQRGKDQQCPFCGVDLPDVIIAAEPPRPQGAGLGFCSVACANNSLRLYVILENK